jgi:tetratricopeptide (TPR) repeat protein
LQLSDYAAATEAYQDALQYTSDASSTQPLIAEAYYRWADQFYRQKNYREATEKFETVLSTLPNYRDAQSRRNDAYQKALRRVAILPFKNTTAQSQKKYADILTNSVLNCCIKANLKYVSFINRANLDLILEEHKLAMSGVVDPQKANQMGKLEGIHYFIIGNITQIDPKKAPSTYQDLTYNKPYSVTDSAGNVVQKTETIKYREYSNSRSVTLSASIQIVEVETGRYVSANNFSQDVVDDFRWINYSGNINDLPTEKQALVNKKPAFRSDEAMISEGLDKITSQMGNNILAYFK